MGPVSGLCVPLSLPHSADETRSYQVAGSVTCSIVERDVCECWCAVCCLASLTGVVCWSFGDLKKEEKTAND